MATGTLENSNMATRTLETGKLENWKLENGGLAIGILKSSNWKTRKISLVRIIHDLVNERRHKVERDWTWQ